MPLSIGAAVGEPNASGVPAPNDADDVFVVQGLLNNIPASDGGASPRLVFDGLIGPKTIGAIRRFQQIQLGFQDGRVDVGQQTIGRLNALADVKCVRLHVKLLSAPIISINTMLQMMRRTYAQAAIGVELVSSEALNLPALVDLDVGSCVQGSTTAEQDELFGHQDGVGVNELAAYFVRSTVPPLNGCAAHPPGPVVRPGLVVASAASQFTLAHEVGHVLGLNHLTTEGANCATPDFTRLMTGCGTSNITRSAPLLDDAEIATMRAAPDLHSC